MIKQYLYPGPIMSYIIGLFGVGVSMSELSPIFRILIGLTSVVILTLTAAIKFEDYLAQRNERLMREDARHMQSFLNFLRARNADIENIDEDDLDSISDMHKEFLRKHDLD